MESRADGFFELVTKEAGHRSRYRFQLADGDRVPDPISRYQPEDVHGPSSVIDPKIYRWRHPAWRGRPWHETVLYELHVGCFTDQGTFDGVRRKLDHLATLGVTAVQLMPVADFPGRRNWGYDGVYLFAPDAAYGTPNDLKALIDELHGRDLMAFLDTVYNHFGPDGNYLHRYAPDYFDASKQTPWGDGVNYDSRTVRDIAIQNALYWLQEFRFDGLRLDAVDQIKDDSEQHILVELAETVRRTVEPDRHVHLVIENDANAARLLDRDGAGLPKLYDAQWNDDIHHVYHHLLTQERAGYYRDYVEVPHARLAKALASGFVYQGEPSAHRKNAPRGEPSGHLPPTAFVSFVQNHDQIGNRAQGDRIAKLAAPEALRAIMAISLLSPQIPLLFMGEEWASTQPFLFFTDFKGPLAEAVRKGRRQEFAHAFGSGERISDPNRVTTFSKSHVDWPALDQDAHLGWLTYTKNLLDLRRRDIIPRLEHLLGHRASRACHGDTFLDVTWTLSNGEQLTLLAQLVDRPEVIDAQPKGRLLFETPADAAILLAKGRLPPWAVLWFLDDGV
jgi:maltooligosyltrehalose trehalohydrolase